MILWLALLAAFGCALSSGIATVLQKMSADKQASVIPINVGVLIRIMRDLPYLVGILLDLLAWILTLFAVHSLPLFIVQPIIAFSVVVTALVESFVFHRKLGRLTVMSIGFIVFGLLILGVTAAPETVGNINNTVRLTIITAPLLLAAIGAIFVKKTSRSSAIVLAVISGLAFGADSIAGRMLVYSPPYWKVLIDPLPVAMLAYGIIGIFMLTISLQRQLASVVMAIVLTSETIAAIVIGLLFLGDSPRHGLWLLMILGASIALVGSVIVATKNKTEVSAPPQAI